MFFTFIQNNSGGVFTYSRGIAEYVIIEAASVDEANSRAEEIGIYFNGVWDGCDCECCGDRWYMCYDSDATNTPEIYGDPAEDYKSVAVHYLNGEVMEF